MYKNILNNADAKIRVTAALLAFVMLAEIPAYAAPFGGASSAQAMAAPRVLEAPAIKLPASVALIDESRGGSSGKFIILIQDAHTNESAQFNSAKAITSILEQRPVRTIFLEAGSGDDSLSYLREAAAADRRREVAERFVRKGLLQGTEFVNLTSDRDLTLWGVEDPELYAQALEAYRVATAGRDEAIKYLDKIDVAIRFIKDKTYSPELLALDQARTAYHHEEISPAAYFLTLAQAARRAGMNNATGPMFALMSGLLARERSLKMDRVALQANKALAELPAEVRASLAASGHDPASYAMSAMRPSESAAWAGVFEAAVGSGQKNMRSRYPELFAYLRYGRLSAAVDGTAALEAMRRTESALYARMARPYARRLVRAAAAAEAMRALALMKFEPMDEVRLANGGRGDWTLTSLAAFLNRRILDLGAGEEKTIFDRSDLVPVFDAAKEFYRLTHLRDRAFVRNLIARMDRTGEREAVLSVGGYHAPGLKELFKSEGIAFVSVIPQSLHPTDRARYEKLLLAQLPAEEKLLGVPGDRPKASAMSLRPTAESGARLAELTNALGLAPTVRSVTRVGVVSAPTAARMAATAPIFEATTPTAEVLQSEGRRVKSVLLKTQVRLSGSQAISGKFYLRYGYGQQDTNWTWAHADFVPVDEASGLYEVRATVHAWPIPRATVFNGTFAFIPTEADFADALDKDHGKSKNVVWQSPDGSGNFEQTLALTKTDQRAQIETIPATIRLLEVNQETPFRDLVAGVSNEYLSALDEALKVFADRRSISPQARVRAEMFRIDLHDRQGNYLNLPPTWWAIAGSDATTEVIGKELWPKLVKNYSDHFIAALHRYLRERMPLHAKMIRDKVFVSEGTPRVDLFHADASDLAPRNSNERRQFVINAPVHLQDLDGREVPAFRVEIENRPAVHIGRRAWVRTLRAFGSKKGLPKPRVRVELTYHNVQRRGEHGARYQERTMEHEYSVDDMPSATDDYFVRYPFGAVGLFADLISASTFSSAGLIGDGRVLTVKIDSYLPRHSGMGGSIMLASTLMKALVKAHLGREADRLTDADYALLGVLVENHLGELGGFQDGFSEAGLRLLQVPAGEPFENVRNDLSADHLGKLEPADRPKRQARANEVLDLLDHHGVLFFEGQHVSSTTLKDIIAGYLRRDPGYMTQVETSLLDAQKFEDLLSGDEPITLDDLAYFVNKQREQFHSVASDYVTPQTRSIIDRLTADGTIVGAKPMGAGAGGFVLFLVKEPDRREALEEQLRHLYSAGGYVNLFRTLREPLTSGARLASDPAESGRTYAPRYLSGPSERGEGARMAEVSLQGDSPAAGSAWGSAALFEPETAEGILFKVASRDIDQYLTDFGTLSEGVKLAIPNLNGFTAASNLRLAGYFADVSESVRTGFADSHGRGEAATNPVAKLTQRIKEDLELMDDGDEKSSRQVLLDLVREQSMHMVRLTDSEEPAARLEAAAADARRGQKAMQETLDRYQRTIDQLDKLISQKKRYLRAKTLQLENKHAQNVKMRNGRKAHALTPDEREESRGVLKSIRKIKKQITKGRTSLAALTERRNVVEVFQITVQEIHDHYFGGSEPLDESPITRRMAEENKGFDAILYHDYLLKKLYPSRRKQLVRSIKNPAHRKQYEGVVEVILELSGLLSKIVTARGVASETFRFDSGGAEGSLILFVNDPLSADLLEQIWNRYGHRIRAIVSTSATMISHWVIVAQSLPSPPAIVLMKGSKALNGVRPGTPVAISAAAGTGQSVVYLHPAAERADELDRAAAEAGRVRKHAMSLLDNPSPIPVYANIVPHDRPELARYGADGIGLVRTEVWDQETQTNSSAVLDAWATATSEDAVELALRDLSAHWFTLYRSALNNPGLHRRNAVFRTLDLEHDKNEIFLKRLLALVREYPDRFPDIKATAESLVGTRYLDLDSALEAVVEGLIGFDFYRTEIGRELLARQIAVMGLARMDLNGPHQRPNLRMMFPNVRSAEDLDFVAQYVLPRAEQLFRAAAGRDSKYSIFPKSLQPTDRTALQPVGEFGTMIETAEATDDLERLAKHPLSGFWSVGTNDLTASLEARSLLKKAKKTDDPDSSEFRVSRDQPEFEDLFTSLTQKLLVASDRIVAAAAQRPGKPLEVGFCGEIAGSQKFMLFLLHLRNHGAPLYASMSLSKIAEAKMVARIAARSAKTEIEQIFKKAQLADDQRAQRLVDRLIKNEMAAGARLAIAAPSADSASTSAPTRNTGVRRLRAQLGTVRAARFMKALSGFPAAQGRPFALQWHGRDRIFAVRATSSDRPQVRVYDVSPRADAGLTAWDFRPIITLPDRARVSGTLSTPMPATTRLADTSAVLQSAQEALSQARRDADGLDQKYDTGHRAAILDLSIFSGMSDRSFESVVPMISAAAGRIFKMTGGKSMIRLEGPAALRALLLSKTTDSAARSSFIDEGQSFPSAYTEVVPTRIGPPELLQGASRQLPVQAMIESGGKADMPAVELWLEAAFYMSAPGASMEKLLEFFKTRTGHSDLTLADINALLTGQAPADLLRKLALPPLLRVPISDLMRAAVTAARMSERSA